MTNLRVRVLVVDDSVVIRRLVTDVLTGDPGIEVVGTAPNGKVALAKVAQLAPDLVTLDIEMPVMDGLETLIELRKDHPRLPVVMFSTLTERGASATLEALERGASDYVTKPSNVGSVQESREAVRQQLVPKIHALAARARWAAPLGRATAAADRAVPAAPVVPATTAPVPRPLGAARPRVDLVVIGSSTGGPDALTSVLTSIPGDLPVPVLITQHMPAVFTKHFADRLDLKSGLRISEAVPGDAIEPGRVLIAPGDWHMRVAGVPGRRIVVLDQGPQENFCRPAVDVMFRSAAEAYGAHVLGVVLTGMGSDGAQGARVLNAAGSEVVVQDEASSVVWGMPGAVVAAGAAQEVVPLSAVAATIVTRCSAGRSGAAAAPLAGGVPA